MAQRAETEGGGREQRQEDSGITWACSILNMSSPAASQHPHTPPALLWSPGPPHPSPPPPRPHLECLLQQPRCLPQLPLSDTH